MEIYEKMIRLKAFAIVSVVLLLLSLGLIQHGTATYVGSDRWYESWHRGSYQNYQGYPYNISTTTTIYSVDYDWWVKIALVVSIYQYQPDYGRDVVNFRVALYLDSFASENLPVPIPVPADFVTFFIDKDTSGSNLDLQYITVESSNNPPGYSQGYGLVQTLSESSSPENRAWWALDAIAFGVGLFLEPVHIAWDLIDLAAGWAPQAGLDYDNAESWETEALSWWHNPGYDFGLQNPVRQYAFNSIRWHQEIINPSTYYGIKVWARVGLSYPNPMDILYVDTSPVYLKIKHYSSPPPGGGGGGCPFVSTWNGMGYLLDNNLLPASEASSGLDVLDYYKLEQPLVSEDDGSYLLLLNEFEQEHDFFDQVKLLAVDHQPNINVAIDPYGEILTYREPSPPVSAIDDKHKNVKYILNAIDDYYYDGHSGSYITLNFGDELDVSNGAKLVMRADFPLKIQSINVQIQDEENNWNTVATVIPRVYWATEIVDLSEYLPDPKGNLKVRLHFTANHKVDFVGLDTSPQATIDIYEGQLISALHSTDRDVTSKLLHSDETHVELLPEQEIFLAFTLPLQTMETRDYIILTEGHYCTIGQENP